MLKYETEYTKICFKGVWQKHCNSEGTFPRDSTRGTLLGLPGSSCFDFLGVEVEVWVPPRSGLGSLL